MVFPNTGHFTATRVFIVDEDDVDEAAESEGAFAIFKQYFYEYSGFSNEDHQLTRTIYFI